MRGGLLLAGGSYQDRYRHGQGFVAARQNGVWGKAIELPGLGALNTRSADVFAVSCASSGDCGAGGDYQNSHRRNLGFVATESSSQPET